MDDRKTLSAEEAGLVLHRLVTEQIPIVAFFSASDQSVKVRAAGVLNQFTEEAGLIIWASAGEGMLPTELSFSHAVIAASVFHYIDDAEAPKKLKVGSSLSITMPNGNVLMIMEVRDPAPS